MASIDVSGAARLKNDVLRKLLHKGNPVGLVLYRPASNVTGGQEAIMTLTSGWNHKEHKNPETGAVTEVLKIVQSSTVTQAVITSLTRVEILYDDSSFVRYATGAKSPLHPFYKEWTINVRPNLADTNPLL